MAPRSLCKLAPLILISLLIGSLASSVAGQETRRWGDLVGAQPPQLGKPAALPNPRIGLLFTTPDYERPTWDWIGAQRVKWIRKQVGWQSFDPPAIPGEFRMDLNDFDFHVEEAGKINCIIVPVLKSQHPDYTAYDPDVDPLSLSYPPDDLGAWSDLHGFSPSYYSLIYGLASRFQNRVPILVIENEPHSLSMWAAELQQYLMLVSTAHLAAHRANPDAIVLNGGFASGALGDSIVRDIYERRYYVHLSTPVKRFADRPYSKGPAVTGPAAALAFYNDYKKHFPEDPHFTSVSELGEYLYRPVKRRNYDFVIGYMATVGEFLDGFNIHFYEDWWHLNTVMDWIEWRFDRVGRSMPKIYSTEGGIRRADPYDKWAEAQAVDLVKQLMVVLTSDVEFFTWFPRDGNPPRNQIGFLNDGQGPVEGRRLASYAYSFLNNRICEQGYRSFERTRVPGEPQIQRVQARRLSGELPLLEVLWWDDGTHEPGGKFVTMSPPPGTSEVIEYYYDGRQMSRAYRSGQSPDEIHVSEKPRVLEFLP